MLQQLHDFNSEKSSEQLTKVKEVAVHNGNIFEALMEATKVFSLGQIKNALFEIGGQYRRNM
jgi:methylmalonyl-CoA mutase